MASARKKPAPSKAPKKSKPAPSRAPKKSKPAPGPAKGKPVRKPVPARARPVAKKAAAKKPVPKKPVPKKLAAAKRPLSVGAAKAAALKQSKRVVPPAKGVALKGGKPAPPPPKGKAKPPRLVPVTAAARAAAALAARASKPGAKGRSANRPEPEVRPLGVLPLSSQAKPRDVAPRHPAPPPRPLTPPKVTPKPQPVRKGDDRLTEDDLKYFEQRLLTERRRIMAEMGHLEATVLKVNPRDAEGEQSGYSYHMADAGTDSMEREKAFDIASKEGRLLLEIDEALRRLYNGIYGLCEISGKPIARTRLDALPWARLSIDEQEKLEREKRLGRMVATDKE